MDPLGQVFVRFRVHTDLDALGAVFDAVSGQLLSLALHMCGNFSDAEDLLQATFVRAMQKSADYDAARPLRPWLCGILTGEAANLRRRQGRRRVEPLPDLLADESQPLLGQERRELIAALRSHVERLPDEQRQVLLLQLQHGLSPTEIAEVLGVAPGTVRMRIHRGLAALRRLLPAGLASLLVWALPSRGLAAVRHAVLAQSQVALPQMLVVGGLLVMKKLLVAVAIVFVCVCGWLAIAPPWIAPEDLPSHGSVVPTLDGLSTVPNWIVTERTVPNASERATRTLPLAMAFATPTAATGVLHVRVVHKDDGSPVQHSLVEVTPRRGDLTRDGILRMRTDAHGEATFGDVPVGDAIIQVRGGEVRRVNVAADAVCELVFSIFWRGESVRGCVIHPDGRPAGGASIVLGTTGAADVVAVTAADGMFALGDVYRFDKIGAVLAGYAPSLLQSLHPMRTIQLVLPGPAVVLGGKVVDEYGAPIVGACIEFAIQGERSQWMDPNGFQVEFAADQRLRSAADGTFRCELASGDVELVVTAPGFAPFAERIDVPAAGIERRVSLLSAAPLQGIVFDQRGALVSDVIVEMSGYPGGHQRTAADGRFAFRSAPRGSVSLHIGGEAIEPLDIVREGEATGDLLVHVQRRPRFHVRLIDDEGVALTGWLAAVTTLPTAIQQTDGEGRCVLVAPARDRGRIELHTPAGAALLVDWPDRCVPEVEAMLTVPRHAQPNASVRGRLLDGDGHPVARGTIEVRRLDLPGVHLRGCNIEEGVFATDPLAAGDYELAFHSLPGSQVVSLRHTVSALQPNEVRDLGDQRLPATGQLSFRVRHRDGLPIVDPTVFVLDEHDHEARAPSTDGTPKPWPTGRYRYLSMVASTEWFQGTCEVLAGQTTQVELVLVPGVRRILRFPVPAPSWGAPSKVRYVLRNAVGNVVVDGNFDPREEPTMTIGQSLSVGGWLVELTTDQGQRFSGSFAVEDLTPLRAPVDVAVQPVR